MECSPQYDAAETYGAMVPANNARGYALVQVSHNFTSDDIPAVRRSYGAWSVIYQAQPDKADAVAMVATRSDPPAAQVLAELNLSTSPVRAALIAFFEMNCLHGCGPDVDYAALDDKSFSFTASRDIAGIVSLPAGKQLREVAMIRVDTNAKWGNGYFPVAVELAHGDQTVVSLYTVP
jgi:hypothetical protein